uniref:Uncharacterized protein n=1 Tax=Treponema maltophilum TaxID=51160 RepID=Q8GBS0_TREMA|nr:hypothetical protein [Treponema maltophilum]
MKLSKKGIIAIVIIALVVLGSAIGFLIWKAQPKGATVAVSILPDSLNPVLEQNTSGLNADELLFDGLVNFEVDKASGSLYSELALAESIVQNPVDKKTYTVMCATLCGTTVRRLLRTISSIRLPLIRSKRTTRPNATILCRLLRKLPPSTKKR